MNRILNRIRQSYIDKLPKRYAVEYQNVFDKSIVGTYIFENKEDAEYLYAIANHTEERWSIMKNKQDKAEIIEGNIDFDIEDNDNDSNYTLIDCYYYEKDDYEPDKSDWQIIAEIEAENSQTGKITQLDQDIFDYGFIRIYQTCKKGTHVATCMPIMSVNKTLCNIEKIGCKKIYIYLKQK
jgi:hypothetical protein